MANPEHSLPINANITHRIFGSVLGIWIGFYFSSRFPNEFPSAYIFILYFFAFIAILSIVMHAGLSRKTFRARLIAYFLLVLCCILIYPGVRATGQITSYAKSISISQEWFVMFVLPFWCITAELTTVLDNKGL